MTANHDIQRRLASYYDTEPPLRAPTWVLQSALSTIEATPQRRGPLAPWRYEFMRTYAKVAAAIVVAVAIGAIGLSLFGRPSGPGATASPAPSPSPTPALSPAPTPNPTPVSGTAADFVPPFSYILPVVPDFDLGTTNETYFEARVPEWANAGHPGGLIVQAIGGGHVDPCNKGSAPLPLAPGPESVLDYLRTVPGVSVTNEADATVDGLPARQATVVATPEADCPEIWAWGEDTESFIAGPVLRLIAFEVDGQHIVVTVFGEPGNPTWPDLADGVVASLRFQRPAASPG